MTRKLLVIPFLIGRVSFATGDCVTVMNDEESEDIRRSEIVGYQPRRDELVIVLDLEHLTPLLPSPPIETDDEEKDRNELITVQVNGTVKAATDKSVLLLCDAGEVWIPKRYVTARIDEPVSEVRLPRWLAIDRGL